MPNDFKHLADDPEVKVFYIHEKALDTIEAMTLHTAQVRNIFGAESPEYIEEASSLLQVMRQMFSFGFHRAQYVTRDGDLSLYVNEGDIFVFGVIFHRNRKYDNPPAGAVQPGSWSCHS